MRRIRRTKDKIYQQFVDEKIFNKLKDVFMIAVTIGYKENKREPFDKIEGQFELIRFNETDLGVINSIALAETNDISILLDDEENFNKRMTIIEEYANYGIDVLKRKVLDAPGDGLENLIDLLYEQKENDYNDNETLEDMVEGLF